MAAEAATAPSQEAWTGPKVVDKPNPYRHMPGGVKTSKANQTTFAFTDGPAEVAAVSSQRFSNKPKDTNILSAEPADQSARPGRKVHEKAHQCSNIFTPDTSKFRPLMKQFKQTPSEECQVGFVVGGQVVAKQSRSGKRLIASAGVAGASAEVVNKEPAELRQSSRYSSSKRFDSTVNPIITTTHPEPEVQKASKAVKSGPVQKPVWQHVDPVAPTQKFVVVPPWATK